MATMTLPVWIIGTAIGLPTIFLLWLIGTLIRKKKKKPTPSQQSCSFNPAAESGQRPMTFHQDLVLMQIDAVFNGLSTLIETERIKLKRLISGHTVQENGAMGHPCDHVAHLPEEYGTWGGKDNAHGRDNDNEDQSAPDQHVQAFASRFGISAAEAELAMKFQKLPGQDLHRKLEAVA
jgi:hypothetical protein